MMGESFLKWLYKYHFSYVLILLEISGVSILGSCGLGWLYLVLVARLGRGSLVEVGRGPKAFIFVRLCWISRGCH